MSRELRLEDGLSASAARHASRPALVEPAGAVWSYRELAARVATRRDELRGVGVRSGDRVGLVLRKSAEAVAAIYGILGSEATYVPVDAAAPAARGAAILRDCGVSALFVEEELLSDLEAAWGEPLERAASVAPGIVLARTRARREAADASLAPAYILYTSGSTGVPKGVMLSHRAALSFLHWCSQTFEPTPQDRFSSHAPFHFDLSILDLHLALRHGSAVVLIDEATGRQPMGLADLIDAQQLSVWYSTPTTLSLLLQYGRLERVEAARLRFMLFAGEVFPIKHLRQLRALWPHPRYLNLYGPTETNVCTFHEVASEASLDDDTPLPIGRACSHARTRVVDATGSDVPTGQEGELVVAGPGVMDGYWNRPELTQQAFRAAGTGQRWYRTGDHVREGATGYVFLGRRDRMVKRRGFRIELDEVETALYRHPGIGEAAAVAVEDDEAGTRIVVFLVVASGLRPPSPIELKRFCSEQLPAYMIPDRFVVRTSLPRTSTDKIDYQALRSEI